MNRGVCEIMITIEREDKIRENIVNCQRDWLRLSLYII